MSVFLSRRVGLASLASLALALSWMPAASADASPTPTPTPVVVPQPSSCAQYRQTVASFVYAGQSATMTVTVTGVYDNAHLTPAGSGTDGGRVVFTPPSATLTGSTSSDTRSPVDFVFTPSATSTVNVNYTDHCSAEAVGHQDRQGSTTPDTVRVVNAAPPSGPPCGAPDTDTIQPDRNRVAAGESVKLAVTIRTLPCYSRQAGPHRFQVVGRPPGQTTQYPYEVVGEGQTDEYGHAEVTATPTRDTRYDFVSGPSQTDSTVTVDRTSGACASKVTATSPASVPIGSRTTISGTAPAGYDVTLHLRRRGQTAFTTRPATVDTTTGRWTSSLVADDDYRYYATTDQCDSPAGLLVVRPTISGPATARRGSTVTLTVHAPAGRGVGVYFRPAGGAFSLRRTGRAGSNGTFAVTYRADRDYRYYAVSSADKRASSQRLTQVR